MASIPRPKIITSDHTPSHISKILVLNTTRVEEKIFPPKNLVYIYIYIYIYTVVLPTRCLCYLILEPSGYLVVLVTRCLCYYCLEPSGLELLKLGLLGHRLNQ